MIERARRLLEDTGDGAVAAHLQNAVDLLEGKPCLQAERDTIVQFELRHRFRNIVAVTQSLVSQTLRPGASMEDARERLTERLAAMGAAVDLLLGAEWEPNPLNAIVRASLAHHADHRERTSIFRQTTRSVRRSATVPDQDAAAPAWPLGESGMAERIRACDWALRDRRILVVEDE